MCVCAYAFVCTFCEPDIYAAVPPLCSSAIPSTNPPTRADSLSAPCAACGHPAATRPGHLFDRMATEVMTLSYEPERSLMGQTSRTQTPKTPLRILDPGRSKLTTVETKRIISVLDDTIVKVELVSMFAYAIEHLEEFVSSFGPELIGALREHLRLSNNMDVMLTRLDEEGLLHAGMEEGQLLQTDDPTGALQLQVQGLRSSVRNIVRLFYIDPIASQTMRYAHERSPPSTLFVRCLVELRGFLYEKLLTTPLEEKEKLRFIHEITLRDKKNTEAIMALENELEAAIKNRDEEVCGGRWGGVHQGTNQMDPLRPGRVFRCLNGLPYPMRVCLCPFQISKKNAMIKDLKTHLHNLAKFSEGQIQRTRTEAEKQQKVEFRGSQGKCSKLQQELNQLKAQLNALITENRESELFFRKVTKVGAGPAYTGVQLRQLPEGQILSALHAHTEPKKNDQQLCVDCTHIPLH